MSSRFQLSVVIPARDAMPFVHEAVQSALQQSMPVAEVVVVDDASSDGTGDSVEEAYGERVRVIRGRFGSAGAARNAGWKAATSPWVAFLDADDLWFPDKTQVAAAALLQAPEARWFFSDGAFRTLSGELHASWMGPYASVSDGYVGQPVSQLIEVNFILTSSVVVRRDVLEAVDGFDEGLTHAEDVDLWIRLARRHPATASRRALVRYQHLESGLTRRVEERLQGDVSLFRRLADDDALEAPLRERAAARASLASYKLAIAALRDGNGSVARRHLPAAWSFPKRTWPVIAGWGLSWLPRSWVAALRRQRWATRGLAAPTLRLDKVSLEPVEDETRTRRTS